MKNTVLPQSLIRIALAGLVLLNGGFLSSACAATKALAVVSPSGGEVWAKGSTQTIRWTAPEDVETVDIFLWHEIVCIAAPCPQRPSALYTIAQGVPNTGRFDWEVPSLLQEIGLPPSGRYYVRVVDPATGDFADAAVPFLMVPAGETTAPATDGNLPDRDDSPNNYGTWEVVFQSGFEPDKEAGLPREERWNALNVQAPEGQPEASIDFVTDIVHSGEHSARLIAPPRRWDDAQGKNFCGKASFVTKTLDMKEGETWEYSTWYYLTDDSQSTAFLLMDVENHSLVPSGPGVRIWLAPNNNGRMQAEWKFMNWFKAIQPEFPPPKPARGLHDLPVNEWFKVTLVLKLGVGEAGRTSIYLNGELDSENIGTNIRPGGPILSDLDWYDSFEVGLTCTSDTNKEPATIYIDDAMVRKLLE